MLKAVKGLTAVLGALPAIVCSAPISFPPAPLLVTAGDPQASRYQRQGAFYSGVGLLEIEHPNLVLGCSGSLLSDGISVLTAAHCVAGDGGVVSATSGHVVFSSPAGEQQIAIESFEVHPDWTGDLRAGADLAIVTLQQSASPAIARYQIYSGSDEVGRTVELIGLGASGTGSSGATIEDGRRRGGFNRLDATFVGTFDRFPNWTAGKNAFLMDFDDGTAAHDALSAFGLVDPGSGLEEVFPFVGDSGGPAFLGLRIAAISSFGTRISRADGSSPDIDSERNGSFGEISGLTRISSYNRWIRTTISDVPEPGSFALMFAPLAILISVRCSRGSPSLARERLRSSQSGRPRRHSGRQPDPAREHRAQSI